MGLFRWFSGVKHERGVVAGDDDFEFHVVGTLHHQSALEHICGERTEEGAHYYCAALLTPQPNNPHDRQAVAVIIHGIEVGHLDHMDSPVFLRALQNGGFGDAACEALIVGGWDRGGNDQGYFGVRLNAVLPFKLYSARDWQPRNASAGRHMAQVLARAL